MTYIINNETKKNNKRLYIANSMYYLGIILLTVKVFLTSSDLIVLNDFIDNIIFFIPIILIISKVVLVIGSIKYLVLMGFIGLACLYTGLKTGSYHIFMSYLIILGSYRSNKRVMIKCISYTSLLLILMHVMFYMFGILFGVIEPTLIYKKGELVYTYTFYLGHSNTASMYIIWTILAFVYLKYKKITINNIIIYSSLMFFNYFFTKSRTGLIISMFAIIMICLDKFILKNNKILKKISKYGFIVLSTFLCILCIFYNDFNNIGTLNKLFSGRLLFASFAFETYGYSLLGQFVDFNQNYGEISRWLVTKLAIDIMPLMLLINYGIFYMIIYGFLLYRASEYSSNEENILFILMIINSAMEIFTMNASMCFPLAICGWYITNSHIIKNIKGYN